MPNHQINLTTTKSLVSKKQPRLLASDAANFLTVLMSRIIDNTAEIVEANDRQIRFATAFQIYYHQLHDLPTTMKDLQEKITMSDNYLRVRLQKLVSTDILKRNTLSRDTSIGERYVYAYVLSDSLVAETVALR